MDNPQVWIAFSALLFTGCCTLAGVAWMLSWKMSDADKAVRKDYAIDLAATNNELTRRIDSLERKMNEIAESAHRSIAASNNAAVQELQRVELYIRDELKKYVLKEDFRDDLATVTKIVDSLGNRLEERLGSMEKKMDDLRDRIPTKSSVSHT